MELIISWWTYEVRLLPMLLALGFFSGFQVLRKLTKIEYTPSYFAIFPLSRLEGQLASYFEEFMTGEYLSIEEGRRKNPYLYLKAWASMFLTFLLVPLVSGFVVAFILTPREFTGFLILLVGVEAVRCLKAIYDFSQYRYEWSIALVYFSLFYAAYIFVLWLVLRFSFHFTNPFTENHDYSALFSALEAQLGPIVIGVLGLGILTNLFAHLLVNKDSIMPSPSGYPDAEWNAESNEDEDANEND